PRARDARLDLAEDPQREPQGVTALAEPVAGRAGDVGHARERRSDALARELEAAERAHAPEPDPRAVALEGLAQRLLDLVDVGRLGEVDEVDDDHAAQVAHAELPRDLGDRLEVGLERRRLEVLL